MFDAEDALWWYRALRLYLGDALDRARLPRNARVLDVGCGSGGNLAMLAGRYSRVAGCDLAEEAVRLCRTRGLARVLAADLNHLPFRTGAFDAVLASDVFESREVDEAAAIAEINDSRFGLQCGVFTSSLERTLTAHDELEVGGVIVNDVPTWRIDPMPYGGVKDSGLGREGLRWSIEDMTELRMLVLNLKPPAGI